MRRQQKLIIGLAGGIGSGKSTVAALLAERGVAVVSSDRLNAEELSQADVVDTLVQWFGPQVRGPDGTILRDRLASIVFADPQKKTRLEGLLHPRVARRRKELISAWQSDPSVRGICLDSPLLFEAGLHEACDAVVFVDAPREQRLARVADTRGWGETELERREKSQEPLDTKRARSDYIIVNNSGLDDLRSEVERLFSELFVRASSS